MRPINAIALATVVAFTLPSGMTTTSHADTRARTHVDARASEVSPRASTSARRLYRNGRYRARGWYGSGPSSITVILRLRKDIVRKVKVTPHATDPTSLKLQRRFAKAVPKVVVGKPLKGLRVGKLAGSSGTPDGFNHALRKIRRQARR